MACPRSRASRSTHSRSAARLGRPARTRARRRRARTPRAACGGRRGHAPPGSGTPAGRARGDRRQHQRLVARSPAPRRGARPAPARPPKSERRRRGRRAPRRALARPRPPTASADVSRARLAAAAGAAGPARARRGRSPRRAGDRRPRSGARQRGQRIGAARAAAADRRAAGLRSPPPRTGRRRARPARASSCRAVRRRDSPICTLVRFDEIAALIVSALEARRGRHDDAGDARRSPASPAGPRSGTATRPDCALRQLHRHLQVALVLRRPRRCALNATGTSRSAGCRRSAPGRRRRRPRPSSVPRRRNSSSIARCSSTSSPFSRVWFLNSSMLMRACRRRARSRPCRRAGSRSPRSDRQRRAQPPVARRRLIRRGSPCAPARRPACAPAARRAAPARARRRAPPPGRRPPARRPGTVTRARTLPFTCTGSSTVALHERRRVGAGPRRRRPAPSAWPVASHSSLATCGTNGASSSSDRVDRLAQRRRMRRVRRRRAMRGHQLHHRRDRGVEVQPLDRRRRVTRRIVWWVSAVQLAVAPAASRDGGVPAGARRGAQRRARAARARSEEAAHALDALIAPVEVALGRRREQTEEPRRVGAVALDRGSRGRRRCPSTCSSWRRP